MSIHTIYYEYVPQNGGHGKILRDFLQRIIYVFQQNSNKG